MKVVIVLTVFFSLCCESFAAVKMTVDTTVQAPSPVARSSDENPGISDDDYEQLERKIYIGRATMAEVKQALTRDDPYILTNTVHALFAMRWHRGVYHLLHGMWRQNKNKYPKLAWHRISSPPVRIALASTINRSQIARTDEQLAYIRSYRDDSNEFNRSQVVIALGFNGDPVDIAYVKSMADSDNHYVAQTAITSLALMGGNQARNAMVDLWRKHRDNEKGRLLLSLLKGSYRWSPDKTTVGGQ